MSYPTTIRVASIFVGDGATPEVFTKLCGLKSRSFTDQTNSEDEYLEDCDDPDGIPVRVKNVTGRQWDVSGEGFYNLDQKALVLDAVGKTRNYRMEIGETETLPAETWTGPFLLETRSITSENKSRITQNMSFANDGPVTIT